MKSRIILGLVCSLWFSSQLWAGTKQQSESNEQAEWEASEEAEAQALVQEYLEAEQKRIQQESDRLKQTKSDLKAAQAEYKQVAVEAQSYLKNPSFYKLFKEKLKTMPDYRGADLVDRVEKLRQTLADMRQQKVKAKSKIGLACEKLLAKTITIAGKKVSPWALAIGVTSVGAFTEKQIERKISFQGPLAEQTLNTESAEVIKVAEAELIDFRNQWPEWQKVKHLYQLNVSQKAANLSYEKTKISTSGLTYTEAEFRPLPIVWLKPEVLAQQLAREMDKASANELAQTLYSGELVQSLNRAKAAKFLTVPQNFALEKNYISKERNPLESEEVFHYYYRFNELQQQNIIKINLDEKFADAIRLQFIRLQQAFPSPIVNLNKYTSNNYSKIQVYQTELNYKNQNVAMLKFNRKILNQPEVSQAIRDHLVNLQIETFSAELNAGQAFEYIASIDPDNRLPFAVKTCSKWFDNFSLSDLQELAKLIKASTSSPERLAQGMKFIEVLKEYKKNLIQYQNIAFSDRQAIDQLLK